ncbi:hypothetical protein ACFT1B_36175, partial [Streptomyces griseoincarnatus]
MTRSPATSQRTMSSGVMTSGEEYSGWAWSTYKRAPFVRITLAALGSSYSSAAGRSTSCVDPVRRRPRPGR